MNATTTKITTEIDFAVSALLQNLNHDDAITLACDVIGTKTPGDYAHLDNGRRKMTAGNLLRGACRKDPAMLTKLEALRANFEDKPAKVKKVRPVGKKAAAKAKATEVLNAVPAVTAESLNWPKSSRFQFATLVNGEPKFFYSKPGNAAGEIYIRPAV